MTAVIAGKTGIVELCHVVNAARTVVCGDTGVAHLATALRTPSVLLFGEPEEHLRQIDWKEFFAIFDRSNVDFLYDPDGHFNKFVGKDRNDAE